MTGLLRAAWIAGLAPLVVGVGIFLLFLVFPRADALMVAGVVTIYVGTGSVIAGLVCLAIYVWCGWRSRAVPRGRLAEQAAGVVALFIANFLVAGGCVFGGALIASRYHLSITNQGPEPLRAARVDGGGVSIEFGDIPAGQTVRRSFWIQSDGELVLTATRGGESLEADVDGYATHGIGVDRAVTVDPSGQVTAEDR